MKVVAPIKSSDFKAVFEKDIVPALKKTLGVTNPFAVPRIKYIKVNVGIGTYVTAGKDHEDVVKNIMACTGQKPMVIKSKKAISNFKLKIGMATGVAVTLRGKRMYDFLTKLIHVVFPRIRDFQGVSRRSFDGRGNYSLGIREHIVFPEISSDDMAKIHGMEITIVTSAKDNAGGLALLEALGFPFKK